MICPRCASTTIDGPTYLKDRRGRRKAAVVTCGSCSTAFDAFEFYGSARDRAFAEFGPWLLAA